MSDINLINKEAKLAFMRAMQNENELINQRLSWLGTFQGLLFAALALGWNNPNVGIIRVICALGFAVAISIMTGTWRANEAIDKLEKKWDDLKKAAPDIEFVGVRSRGGYFWWVMPGYFIPPVFAIAWAVIFFIRGC